MELFIFRMRVNTIGQFWTKHVISVGLWKICDIDFRDRTTCEKRSSTCKFTDMKEKQDMCNKLLLARQLMIATCVLSGIAAISCYICAIKKINQYRYLFLFCQIPICIVIAIGIPALLCGIYASSYNFTQNRHESSSLAVGASLFIAACDLTIFSAMLTLYIH